MPIRSALAPIRLVRTLTYRNRILAKRNPYKRTFETNEGKLVEADVEAGTGTETPETVCFDARGFTNNSPMVIKRVK